MNSSIGTAAYRTSSRSESVPYTRWKIAPISSMRTLPARMPRPANRNATPMSTTATGRPEKVRREPAFVQDRAHEQQHRNGGVQELVAVRQRAVYAMENRSHLLDADASGQDAQAREQKCNADEHDRHRQAGEGPPRAGFRAGPRP